MSELENAGATENRNIVRGVTLAAAGLAAATFLTPKRARAITPALTFAGLPGTGDVKVLNYALALEDLESALYQAAISRLTALGANSGTTAALFNAISEFSTVEADHAAFLRAAITSAAPSSVLPRYTYSFTVGTTPLAQADARSVYELVLQAEATGVRAYLGAIPFFTARSSYLPIAAAIQGTEARHTTALTQLGNAAFGLTRDVAPLATDSVGGTTFSYDGVSGGYNSAKPNEGSNGVDDHLSPDIVLTAVSPFIVGPVTQG